MEESNSPDHLSSSLTDLMTSLMVIFILLLLVFVQRTGAKDTAAAKRLSEELKKQLKPWATEEKGKNLYPDQNRVYIIAPERLMSFESGKYTLSQKGDDFLLENLPTIARTLYDKQFRDGIESIVVEGYSDSQSFQGLPPDESQNRNLELSQQRAMEVVRTALEDLKTTPTSEQKWFVSKLSSSGRGQQGCGTADIPANHPSIKTVDPECRKVIFVIRVQASEAKAIDSKMK